MSLATLPDTNESSGADNHMGTNHNEELSYDRRLADLAEAIESKRYRVDADVVASSMLKALGHF